MRIRVLLLTAATAAAAFAPASAHAAGAKPCDDGEIGVVVYDDAGDLVTVCVRDDLDPVREYLGSVVDWVEDEPLPECVYYPGTGEIECERPTFPPLPPIG